MLPAAHLVPSDSQCRKSLTGNPWSHPCVINTVSPSSNLVTCLPITSFSTVPLEEKAKSWGWARRYLPIQHDGDGKLDRHLCGLKPLPLAGNQAQLKRQSFVNLETEFSIEAQLLLPLANGDICIDIDALRRELASFRGEQMPRARPARTESDSGYETSSNKSDRSVSSERAPASKPAGARCRTQEGAPEISAPAWRTRSSIPTKKRDFGGNWRRRN
ncbi:hypothetical protein M8818_002110 [Zalaria obscura]|uniref:Uncharacterized protein n=1 Tax=Zalaria obscura TaxID=2024903 RepID=A0ACC3SII5_9PEZI